MHAVKMMSDLFTNVQVSLHTDGSGVEMCRHSFVELTYICPLCSLSGTMRLTWRSWRSAYARLRWTGFCGEHPNWCQLATASRSCRSTVWSKTIKWVLIYSQVSVRNGPCAFLTCVFLPVGCQVGTDILEEQITAFEDYVQSMDVAAFNKIWKQESSHK